MTTIDTSELAYEAWVKLTQVITTHLKDVSTTAEDVKFDIAVEIMRPLLETAFELAPYWDNDNTAVEDRRNHYREGLEEYADSLSGKSLDVLSRVAMLLADMESDTAGRSFPKIEGVEPNGPSADALFN
jgi:hypothetical protein